MLFATIAVPQMVFGACPPPKTPLPPDQFHYCFDPVAIAPQPIIRADKGPFLVVEVELNGHKLPALLDTGAEISVVDTEVAREIGLKSGTAAQIIASDGRKANALKTSIDKLVIGGLTRFGGFVVLSDLSEMQHAADQPFAVIVGADLLAQVALAVDRDSQSLIVMPSSARPSGSGWMASLHLRQPGNLLMTDMIVEGHPITVRIDTGSENEVTLRDIRWSEIVSSSARATTFAGIGAAGLFAQPMIRLRDVKIGEDSVGDAIATEVASPEPTGGSDGILGMGILSRFDLFMNPQAGVMLIRRPKRPMPPRRETMVGIQGPPTDNGITIMHVMAHSPAESAGLKAGDHICMVDGEMVRASWYGDPKHDWMTGPEGRTVVLGRCGGGEIRLTLRKFY